MDIMYFNRELSMPDNFDFSLHKLENHNEGNDLGRLSNISISLLTEFIESYLWDSFERCSHCSEASSLNFHSGVHKVIISSLLFDNVNVDCFSCPHIPSHAKPFSV